MLCNHLQAIQDLPDVSVIVLTIWNFILIDDNILYPSILVLPDNVALNPVPVCNRISIKI